MIKKLFTLDVKSE